MTGSLDAADDGQLEWDRNLNPLSLLVAFVGGVLVAVICLIQNNVEGKWFIAAAIGAIGVAIVALWPSRRLRRLAPEYRERSAKWESFQRWTDDFPRLEDDPPATLELWKRILIYGVAFGTADRMIKSGRIPEPVLQSSDGSWSSGYLTGRVRRLLFLRQLLQLWVLLPGGARVLQRRRRGLQRGRWRRRRRRWRRLVGARPLFQPGGLQRGAPVVEFLNANALVVLVEAEDLSDLV